jgi:hypothetical protein
MFKLSSDLFAQQVQRGICLIIVQQQQLAVSYGFAVE